MKERIVFPEHLCDLIKDFHEKLDKAQNARDEIIEFLRTDYDVTYDDLSNYDWLENECLWCYGIDIEKLEVMLGEKRGG